jgi:hypothetical protein
MILILKSIVGMNYRLILQIDQASMLQLSEVLWCSTAYCTNCIVSVVPVYTELHIIKVTVCMYVYFIFFHFSHIMKITKIYIICLLQATIGGQIFIRWLSFFTFSHSNSSPLATHREQPGPLELRIHVILFIRVAVLLYNLLTRLILLVRNR